MGLTLQARQAIILVVDDDAEIRAIVGEYLRDVGYEVMEAAGGDDALRLLRQARCVHLMITDIRMPGLSGFELVDQAISTRSDLKVIFMSGFSTQEPATQAFLRKPFRLADLGAAVRTILAKGGLAEGDDLAEGKTPA